MTNILFSGFPRSGKSTLLERLISDVSRKRGFVTREVRDRGVRTGFEVVGHDGSGMMLASVDSQSAVRVSRYGVDVGAFDASLGPYFDIREGELLYIDEIGEMELYSDDFRRLVSLYLDSPNHFIGTVSVVCRDPMISAVTRRPDVEVIGIGPDNREEVYVEMMQRLRF